jgi:hypothetical protein
MSLEFHCARELDKRLSRPIPAVLGPPDWFMALPRKAFNPTMGGEARAVKKNARTILPAVLNAGTEFR